MASNGQRKVRAHFTTTVSVVSVAAAATAATIAMAKTVNIALRTLQVRGKMKITI